MLLAYFDTSSQVEGKIEEQKEKATNVKLIPVSAAPGYPPKQLQQKLLRRERQKGKLYSFKIQQAYPFTATVSLKKRNTDKRTQ